MSLLSTVALSVFVSSPVNAVDHKISAVTIFSDKARVTRSTHLKVGPGKRELKFKGLLEKILPNSIRSKPAANFDGKILQIVLEQSFEQMHMRESLKTQLHKLEELRRTRISKEIEREQLSELTQFLGRLQFQPEASSAEKSFALFNENTKSLSSALDGVSQELARLSNSSVQVGSELQAIDREIEFTKAQLELATQTENQKWVTDVSVQIESYKQQDLDLQLTYDIPEAKWYPIYDFRTQVNPSKNQVDINLVSAALIEQHTGEDWKDIALTVSSLDPQPLYIPSLNRWLLKEKRYEAPRTNSPSEPARLRSPVLQNQKKETSGKQRLDNLRSLGVSSSLEEVDTDLRDKNSKLEKSLVGNAEGMGSKKDSLERQIALKENSDQYDAEGRISPNLPSTPQAIQSSSVALYRLEALDHFSKFNESSLPQIRSLPASDMLPGKPLEKYFSDSLLPAAQANGRKLEFLSPFSVSLENDEAPKRISLYSQRFQGKIWHYAVPKQDSRVYMKSLTTNVSEKPLLGGRAQVFVDGDLIHKTTLGTISEGSSFELDLGVDPDIKISRVSSRKSEERGVVFFKKHNNIVTVKIEAVNHHKHSIDLQILDHFPHASQKEMESKLIGSNIKPVYVSDANTLEWRLSLQAGQKQVIEFSYQVVYPEDFLLAEALD